MVWPNEHEDTVLYEDREIISDKDFVFRSIDDGSISFYGDLYINGDHYQRPVSIDIREYGAIGDGVIDDTFAIQAALDQAKIVKGTIVISPGTYNHTGLTVTFASDVTVLGMGGTLYETTGQNPHLTFNTCSNVRILNLNVSGAPGARTSGSRGLNIATSSDVLIQGCTISDPRGGGLYVNNSEFVRILGNKIYNSMADGIHITNKSHHVIVIGNETDSTGDDCIAVVSYVNDGGKCSDVVISNNIGRNGDARGITALGGDRISISNNVIDTMAGSGIIAGLDSGYNTYGCDSLTIVNNMLRTVGVSASTNGLTVNCSDVYSCDNVIVQGNTLLDARYRGICFTGTTNGMRGAKIEDNIVVRCSNNPLRTTVGQGLSIKRNTLIDCGNTQISILPATNTVDAVIADNVVLNPNAAAVANMRFISSETDTPTLVIIGNRVDGGTLQSMYRIPNTTNAIIRDNLRDGVVADTFNSTEPVVANRGLESVWSNQVFKGNIGFYGSTPVARPTVSVAAIDAGTTQTLVNSLRTALVALGLVV